MSPEYPKNREPEVWTAKGLVHWIKDSIHEQMRDRSFVFVLGSGASVESGIPTGGELVSKWLQELHERLCRDDTPLEQWATAENLDLKVDGFEYARAAEFYPWIYRRRFRDLPEEGVAEIEHLAEKGNPSFGYSVLAQIMAEGRHSVVVTTNFDNLVADALLMFTGTHPLVCGHESLTGFVDANLRRPLVAKVHRDVFLAPKSTPEEIAALPSEWEKALHRVLKSRIPLVIGYGGNDGGFIKFLESLEREHLGGPMRWCYREADGEPNRRIKSLVANLGGSIAPIEGFDKFMLLLNEAFGFGFLDEKIEKQAKARAETYRGQVEKLQGRTTGPEERAALDAALAKGKGWWAWELRARREKDPEKREAIYRQGLKEAPNSPILRACFADFMTYVRKEHDEAERLYRRALEIEPYHAGIISNFAIFMTDIRKDHDEAEGLYRRALEIAPNNANNTANFAGFLLARGRMDEAKPMAARAWDLARGGTAQAAAEAALYRGLMARIEGRDDAQALGRLKTLLAAGYERKLWSFDHVLGAAEGKIPADDAKLYRALADAILEESKVTALDTFARWRDTKPIPLDASWPEVT